jgi:hypothetical protein
MLGTRCTDFCRGWLRGSQVHQSTISNYFEKT